MSFKLIFGIVFVASIILIVVAKITWSVVVFSYYAIILAIIIAAIITLAIWIYRKIKRRKEEYK